MKSLCWTRCLGVIVLLACGCAQRPAPEPVRIGHLTSLSGSARTRGASARRGVELAVAGLTADDAAASKRGLVVLHADHQGRAEVLQAEAVRLLSVNRVSALLVDCDARLGEALARATQAYGVPVVLTRELIGAPPGGVWVLGAGPAARGRALARALRGQPKRDRLAIVAAADAPLADAVADALQREAAQPPPLPTERWSFANEATLGELLPSVNSWRPDSLVLTMDVPALGPTLRRLAGLQAMPPLYFAGPDVPPALVRSETGATTIVLASAYAPEALTEKGREFAAAFAERFGAAPDLDAAQAYDAVRLLAEAIHQSKLPGGREYRKELARMETFESVTGPIKWIDRQAHRPVYLLSVAEQRVEWKQTSAPDE